MFKKQNVSHRSNFSEEESQGILQSAPVLHLFANKPEHWEDKWDLVKAIVNMEALKTLSAAPCLTVDNKQVFLFPFLSL